MGHYRKEYQSEEINKRNAVLRFQSEHNLIVDGIFGKRSRKALEKRVKDIDFQYPDEIKEPPTEGKWIVINKSKRILTLYKGKEVIKKYPIAQGKLPSYTPEGKFSIATKIVNPWWGGGGYAKPVKGGVPENPLGYRWMGLSLGGGSSYGIHGNNSPYSIGTNVSHGCIRMINSDVEELFEIVPLYTKVWIGTDQKLEEWGVKQTSYIEVAEGVEDDKDATNEDITNNESNSSPANIELEDYLKKHPDAHLTNDQNENSNDNQ